MRISGNPVLSWIAIGYLWIFRGAPALLQLMLWFNLALIFPTLGIPGLFEFRTVDIMTPFVAAMLGLGIQQGAYTSEVVRSGLLSVDSGQYEAARTIGMTQMKMLRRIVLPQAMRVMVPPVGNEVIGMVKLTSLASVIQFSEILHNAQVIYYANTRVLELLLVASFWYLVVVSVLSVIQQRIERYYGRGSKSIRASM
ncbi:MAG: amino acid ABC transporter permease, partial [Rhizobiaceae bacterium]